MKIHNIEDNYQENKIYSFYHEKQQYEYDSLTEFLHHQAEINGKINYYITTRKADDVIICKINKITDKEIEDLLGFVIK